MNTDERDFFKKIRNAVFANPFAPDRFQIDVSAAGLTRPASSGEVLAQLIAKVGETIEIVEKRQQTSRFKLPTEDQELLQYGKLFHVFHLFCDTIDEHIREQVSKGNERCSVHFAKDLLALLSRYGFSKTQGVRFLELFFQMRRAFYFISKIQGSSECVMKLRKALWNNVFTKSIQLYEEHLWNRMEDFSTMILGETGTGKGMAASAIGRSGYIPFDQKSNAFRESFAKTFVSINLSQFQEQLIESELFGHRKGSFTGAVDSHNGIFHHCSRYGAIFLDEIGDVSTHIQIKLLRVLQERLYTPVGSHKPEKFRGRVIAATNQSLDQAREDGRFRNDFFYRLCSDIIEVPPLSRRIAENPNELEELIRITVTRILGCESDQITTEMHKTISKSQPKGYSWPGNIRELEQCVRQMLLNGKYHWQNPKDYESMGEKMAAQISKGEFTAQELLSFYCNFHYKKLGTFEAVSQLTELDRRTVKKYIQHSDL